MGTISLLSLLFVVQLPQYHISCDQVQFDYMMENWEEEISISCTVTADETVYENCTMRIRGDTSRAFRKKSYRIEFPLDQPHLGRTSWNFNADFLDSSYMRAWLFSRVLTDMGFPCFQVSHAGLNVNGDFRGLFLMLEPVNESFLERYGFDPEGSLYKAQLDGACASIHDDVDSMWVRKTGGSSGMNDLEALINQLEYRSPDQLQGFMDSTFTMYGSSGLIRMLAINAAFANNSTYYHNYYLFNDALGSGLWFMFPWDVDKVLSVSLGISYGGCTNENWYDNPLYARTLTVPIFREAFSDSVESIYSTYLTEAKMTWWADSLRNALMEAVEQDGYDNTDAVGFLEAISELQSNLSIRGNDLEWQFQYKYFPFRSYRSDSLTSGSLEVSWSPTSDPSGNPANYTVVVRDSLGPFSQEILRFEGIEDSVFTIDGLEPGKYWWTVETDLQAGWRRTEATDRYNPFTVVEPVVLSGTFNGTTRLVRAMSPYYVPEEIVVSPGGVLEIEAGVTILMGEQGAVDCYGSILSMGTQEDSVFIIAENSADRWRGIRVKDGTANLTYTVISGSRGYAETVGNDFAGLTCHRTNVTIENCCFRDNWSCIKLFKGAVEITGSIFRDNAGELFFIQEGNDVFISRCGFHDLENPVVPNMDAIEFHYCTTGTIIVQDCIVSNIDGDCIDMNASSVQIMDTQVSGASDKGFSIAGGSGIDAEVSIDNCVILDCPIGIAVKDGAEALIDNVLIQDCATGVTAYEKYQGLGGGYAWVENSILSSCTEDITVEEGAVSVEWSISDSAVIPGQGNISGDPGLDAHGYPLWNSPCINAGNPQKVDPDGSRKDIGAFFFPTMMTGLCINELMAINDSVILDDWNRTSDWIEVYNGTGYDLDAGVLVFSESDSSAAEPWSVPRGTMIPAWGYMLFWADGDGWKGGTHLPFRLSGAGDGFSFGRIVPGEGDYPFVSAIERIDFPEQSPDVSLGRFPDGGQWQIIETPTPGYSNGTLYSVPISLSLPRPNPCRSGTLFLDVTVAGGQTQVFVYDLTGRKLMSVHDSYCDPGTSTFTCDTSGFPSGVYLVLARCTGQKPATAKFTVLH